MLSLANPELNRECCVVQLFSVKEAVGDFLCFVKKLLIENGPKN